MTIEQILKQRDQGEATMAQFKERIADKYDVACELVAMSNSKGGLLAVGVNDKNGNLNPLSYQEVQETTALLANMASENVIPAILLDIENVAAKGGSIVVATVKEGLNKPYHDNKGIVWVKNGADKRKVFDNAELAEMMTECGSFNPDEAAVRNASLEDLDEQTLKLYLLNRFEAAITKGGVDEENMRYKSLEEMVRLVSKGFTPEKLLRNLHLIRPDGQLTSPGELPNGLSVDDILAGTSMPRNALLFENAIHLLPYTGAGSGIPRAMEPNPHVTFPSDDSRHEFIITIELAEGQLVPAEEVKRLKDHPSPRPRTPRNDHPRKPEGQKPEIQKGNKEKVKKQTHP